MPWRQRHDLRAQNAVHGIMMHGNADGVHAVFEASCNPPANPLQSASNLASAHIAAPVATQKPQCR